MLRLYGYKVMRLYGFEVLRFWGYAYKPQNLTTVRPYNRKLFVLEKTGRMTTMGYAQERMNVTKIPASALPVLVQCVSSQPQTAFSIVCGTTF